MTDDEVLQWLSETEKILWIRHERTTMRADVIGPLRSLAETRKALASAEWSGVTEDYRARCPICFNLRNPDTLERDGPHHETCIIATMPRPHGSGAHQK